MTKVRYPSHTVNLVIFCCFSLFTIFEGKLGCHLVRENIFFDPLFDLQQSRERVRASEMFWLRLKQQHEAKQHLGEAFHVWKGYIRCANVLAQKGKDTSLK